MITTNLVLKIIFIFIAALCLIMLLSIDKEHYILNIKMKTIINVLIIFLSILIFLMALFIKSSLYNW